MGKRPEFLYNEWEINVMARAWDDWGHRLVTVEKERKGLCESNFETEINAGNSLAACGERTAQKS